MKARRSLDRVLDGLHSVDSFDALSAHIVDLRDAFEVEHLVYHSVNAVGGQYAALTYDQAWVDQYIDQNYARLDPVVQGCFRRFTPVDWKALDWSGRPQRAFFAEAVAAGVGNQGLSIPIRAQKGRFSLFTINHRARDRSWARLRDAALNDLLLLAHYINETALQLEGSPADPGPTSLSPREIDALTMLAEGRSRAQAAESLRISEHTLRTYIESARLKLGAVNTTNAVARALTQGFLVL